MAYTNKEIFISMNLEVRTIKINSLACLRYFLSFL
jgi:hypothetical protein